MCFQVIDTVHAKQWYLTVITDVKIEWPAGKPRHFMYSLQYMIGGHVLVFDNAL